MPQSTPEPGNASRGSGRTGGQDVAILFATRVGVTLFSLLIQGMLAYMLLPEGRGSYAVCITFGTLFGLLFTPGSQQGAQYLVMTKQASVSQGMSSALTIGLVGGGLAIALALPLIHSDIAFFDKAKTRSFHLALVLIPLTAFSAVVEYHLLALRRFARLAVFSLLRVAVNALAVLLLVRVASFGVDGAILALAASHLVMIAVCLRDLRQHCGLIAETPSPSSLARVLGYGLRYHPALVGDGLKLQIGILVLGLIANQADIGLFAAASTLMLGFVMISNAIGNALLPRIAGMERPELTALCLRLVCWITMATLAAFLAISTPLVRLLLSEAFLPIVPLLWILAPGILAHAGTGILMTYFKAVNRPDICSWAVCLGLCVDLGALLLLYARLGLAAAAWAMMIGMFCRCLFLAVMFRRRSRMAWLPIWSPRRGDARFLWEAARSLLGRGTGERFAA